MAEHYSIEQAMAILHMSRNRVARWMKKLSITAQDHPHEGRVKLLTEADINAIRAASDAATAMLVVKTPTPSPRVPPPPEIAHRPVQDVSKPSTVHNPGRMRSAKPPLPDGWVSFEDAWKQTGIAGNWRKSQVDKARWATQGPFLHNRATVEWALSPEQLAAFLAHYGEGLHS